MSGQQLAEGLAAAMSSEVYGRLETLARAGAGLVRVPREDLDRLRADLALLVAGLRKLVAAHQPDGSGRCAVCRGWVRRRRWPCRVWLTAHRMLIGQDTAVTVPQPAPGRAAPGGSGVPAPAGLGDGGGAPPLALRVRPGAFITPRRSGGGGR